MFFGWSKFGDNFFIEPSVNSTAPAQCIGLLKYSFLNRGSSIVAAANSFICSAVPNLFSIYVEKLSLKIAAIRQLSTIIFFTDIWMFPTKGITILLVVYLEPDISRVSDSKGCKGFTTASILLFPLQIT